MKLTSSKRNNESHKNDSIPKDWIVTTLGKLGKTLIGLTYSPEAVVDEGKGTLVLRSSNIQGNTIVFEDNVFVDCDIPERAMVKEGDILVCVRNGSRSLIGKSARINKECKGMAFGAFMSVFRSDQNDYLIHVFQSGIFQKEINRNIGATINQITSNDLVNFKLPFPPLDERKAIAKVLSTWDNAISKTTALITKKELQLKWLMQELLTGKRRLRGFDENFRECTIHQLFDMVDRYVEWDERELYKLVSIRRRFGGLFYREELYGEQIGVKKLKRIRTGDFLISKRQVSHGAWAVVVNKFNNSKVSDEYDCLVAKDKEALNISFWSWYCQQTIMQHYAYLDSNGVHIEKSIFDYSQFKKRSVRIPSTIKEQVAIAKVLDAAEKEIQLLKTKRDKLKKYKQGLMQMLLTGTKRLKMRK